MPRTSVLPRAAREYSTSPQAPSISEHAVEMTMKKTWKAFKDTSDRRRFHGGERRDEQDDEEERRRQREYRIDDLALVEEVHEHARHHARLHAGDGERDG